MMIAVRRYARSRQLYALIALVALFATQPATAQEPGRSFHLGFTPLPPVFSTYGRGIVNAYLRGASDLVSHTFQHGVPWPEALQSSDWRTYPEDLRKRWADAAFYDDYFLPTHARYISIHPINYAYNGPADYWGAQGTTALTAPWNAHNFNHPDVKQAFLNYAIATIEYFQPEYLGLGVESNILLARAPQKWAAYKELNAFIYSELKQRYPQLTIFVSVQYEHMLGQHTDSQILLSLVGAWWPTVLVDEVQSLLTHSDLLVLSTYPFMTYDAAPVRSHYDLAVILSQQTQRPLAIEQTGHTSKPIQIYQSLLPGSEALQRDFVAMVLDLAASHQFAFVVNFVAIDYGTNYGTDPVSMTWAYTGLFRQDGSTKPAGQEWLSYLARPRIGAVADQR